MTVTADNASQNHSTPRERAVRSFTRDEYYRMWEIGFFENQRVELIDGEILVMSPQKNPHASTLTELVTLFHEVLPRRQYLIRPQMPLSVSDASEPEPDLAIVQKKLGVVRGEHPCTAELVVEVAETSIAKDRRKAGLYASAAVPEYWIVDVAVRKVYVHTEPANTPGSEFGSEYKKVRTFGIGDRITPVSLPVKELSVEQIFLEN